MNMYIIQSISYFVCTLASLYESRLHRIIVLSDLHSVTPTTDARRVMYQHCLWLQQSSRLDNTNLKNVLKLQFLFIETCPSREGNPGRHMIAKKSGQERIWEAGVEADSSSGALTPLRSHSSARNCTISVSVGRRPKAPIACPVSRTLFWRKPPMTLTSRLKPKNRSSSTSPDSWRAQEKQTITLLPVAIRFHRFPIVDVDFTGRVWRNMKTQYNMV